MPEVRRCWPAGGRMMRALSLFSGIGGMDLGAQWAGCETVAFCECEPFCQAVLKAHWPGIPIYDDVRTLTGDTIRAACGHIDIAWGGPPCQPASCAGQRKGRSDERWLWGEFLRLVCDIRPMWVLAENPPGLASLRGGEYDGILHGLEAPADGGIGYDLETFCVGADDVGAPHVRKRLWIVGRLGGPTARENLGDAERAQWRPEPASGIIGNRGNSVRQEAPDRPCQPGAVDVAYADSARLQMSGVEQAQPRGAGAAGRGGGLFAEPGVGSVTHGVPGWLVGRWPAGRGHEQHAWEPPRGIGGRMKNRPAALTALGNAIVPQVAYAIIAAIMAATRSCEGFYEVTAPD